MSSDKQAYVIGDGGFAREVAAWAEMAGWKVVELVGPERQRGIVEEAEYWRSPFNAFLGLGRPAHKKNAVAALGTMARYPSLNCGTVAGGSSVGPGCVICPGVVVTTNVTLGHFVTLNLGCTVGHDAVLDDFCSLMPQVAVSGFCRVGDGAYLGVHSAVLEGLRVGPGAVLGAGAVLTKDLPGGETWVGVPARRLK